jgi:hypothetical protein
MKEIINPSISKEEFETLGFRQITYAPNIENGGTWSVRYRKDLNENHIDYLEVFWTTCNGRYQILRQTEGLRNMYQFEGFLNSVKDLEYILPLFDLRRFYEKSIPQLRQ